MLSILRIIKPSVNKNLDNCSILSIKHALNVYMDDDKNIKKSLKPLQKSYHELSINNDDDTKWLNQKSIEQALCNYK
jgi:hypothetical protein